MFLINKENVISIKMSTKKYPSMIGCSIQRFHGYPDLYEEYGILNHRDNSYRLKI